MNHWESCQGRVLKRADDLARSVVFDRLNESAVEGLVKSFLDQPAYHREWRPELFEFAMTQFVHRLHVYEAERRSKRPGARKVSGGVSQELSGQENESRT